MDKKFLFVIDMQNDFIDGSLGSNDAKEIVPNVVKLIQNWCNGQSIFVTRDTHYEDKGDYLKPSYESTMEGKMLPIRHCIENTSGWKINEYVQDALDNYKTGSVRYFDKTTFGSLDMVNEASLYLWENIDSNDEIHICGLCTDICVVNNALLLRAKFPNLHIYVHKNCCAGTSKEANEAALLVMKSCQIEVI